MGGSTLKGLLAVVSVAQHVVALHSSTPAQQPKETQIHERALGVSVCPKTQIAREDSGAVSSHRREVLRDLDLVDDDKLVLAARVLPLVVACARVTLI